MNLSDFVPVKGIWMYPFWFGAFVLGLMLLAPGSLPPEVERWTLPSLLIYLVGVGNLIFWKELYHRRYMARVDERKNLPTGPIVFFGSLHAILFGGWVWYNVWKAVI